MGYGDAIALALRFAADWFDKRNSVEMVRNAIARDEQRMKDQNVTDIVKAGEGDKDALERVRKATSE